MRKQNLQGSAGARNPTQKGTAGSSQRHQRFHEAPELRGSDQGPGTLRERWRHRHRVGKFCHKRCKKRGERDKEAHGRCFRKKAVGLHTGGKRRFWAGLVGHGRQKAKGSGQLPPWEPQILHPQALECHSFKVCTIFSCFSKEKVGVQKNAGREARRRSQLG